MTETDFRNAIVEQARSWIGTPYMMCGRVKGVGVNCAQLLYGVAKDASVLPEDAPEPRFLTPQFAMHVKQEKLVDYITSYGGVETTEDKVKNGDVILFKTGMVCGHAAIIVDWDHKLVVHSIAPQGCHTASIHEGRLARYQRRYFTLWKG